jgi:hypothetical protein
VGADVNAKPLADWTDEERLELLNKHAPLLRYDPQDPLRVLAAESAVENPGNVLLDPDGEVIARAGDADGAGGEATDPPLSLELLLPGGNPPGGREQRLAQAPGYLGDTRRMQAKGHTFAGRIYGRVVGAGDGGTWLQYWLFYYYNPKNVRGVGKHEGDWEMVQVHLKADGKPDRATYAQHEFGEAQEWEEVETKDGHPIAYVGNLSHASYFKRGTRPYAMLRRYLPLGIDHAFGGKQEGPPQVPEGPEETPRVELLPSESWPRWPGQWGSGEHVFLGQGDGPSSPEHQGEKWSNPDAFDSHPRSRVLHAAGSAAYEIGKLFYPQPPRVESAAWDGDTLVVRYALQTTWRRRTSQVLITVNEPDDPQLVLVTRVIAKRDASGEERFQLRGRSGQPLRVWATAFNGGRQRSNLASREVA